jgi:quercetin dioxygenase-like cupin family protein
MQEKGDSPVNRKLGKIGKLGIAVAVVVWVAVMTAACSPAKTPPGAKAKGRPGLPPEPAVTYSESDAKPGQAIRHGELILGVDEARRLLHAQHHPHKVLETRRVPGLFKPPAMMSVGDFALSKKDLVVINPGPGEYVHVMEGQRHGYRNLTIGITYTAPGGAPPMHTHAGEEAHVLLEGKILYALGDKVFSMEGPYVVNIPPMVPHSFRNEGDRLAELVVIFPTNVWEYDVLDYFPFKNLPTQAAVARGVTK